jgi:C4-dicarboxylate-specific signal transduction histidine kinase
VSLASIRGRATGVGSEFALASDMRLASREKAILSQWKVGAALVPVIDDARRAAEIIDSIRTMAARGVSTQSLIALDDVIRDSTVFLEHELQSKAVSISLDLASNLPMVFGDRTQLQQVIVNLAINAVQAITTSQVLRKSIGIRAKQIDADTVCCIIEDSGPGIDASHLPYLFDSFFTTKETGMGLGLPIAQSIIEAHNGRIRADNNSSIGGARFILSCRRRLDFQPRVCTQSDLGWTLASP